MNTNNEINNTSYENTNELIDKTVDIENKASVDADKRIKELSEYYRYKGMVIKANGGYAYVLNRVEENKRMLKAFGPYRFFLTISFQTEFKRHEAMYYGKKYLRRFMRSLLGQKWKKQGLGTLEGIVVIESAPIYKNVKKAEGDEIGKKERVGGHHLHILMKDHPALPVNDNAALTMVQNALNKASRGFYRDNTRISLISYGRALAKLVHNEDGLCGYCAKDAKKSGWNWDDWCFYLSEDGFSSY
ncbi:hypothetical protein [Dyella sp. 20L07]|uniref:hypothetical protein n=1 Tax=Dyella sp. 20L07 TaxID=3384240 RepID=UPI003D275C3A